MTQEKQQRQLHLGAFFFGVGHHLAAWRHPDVDPTASTTPCERLGLRRPAQAQARQAVAA